MLYRSNEMEQQAVLQTAAKMCAAAQNMVVNRIMFSIGKTAAEMDFAPDCTWLGIPLSVSGKNIFYQENSYGTLYNII